MNIKHHKKKSPSPAKRIGEGDLGGEVNFFLCAPVPLSLCVKHFSFLFLPLNQGATNAPK